MKNWCLLERYAQLPESTLAWKGPCMITTKLICHALLTIPTQANQLCTGTATSAATPIMDSLDTGCTYWLNNLVRKPLADGQTPSNYCLIQGSTIICDQNHINEVHVQPCPFITRASGKCMLIQRAQCTRRGRKTIPGPTGAPSYIILGKLTHHSPHSPHSQW
jgi:hypothetical protein